MTTPGTGHFSTDRLHSGLTGRTVRGGVLSLAGQASRSVLTLLSTVVLARLLTPEDFGLIGMVAAVFGFLNLFRELGLSHATVQRERLSGTQASTLFWYNAVLGLAVALAGAGLAPVLAWFFGEPRLLEIGVALAATALVGGLSVQHRALLQRQMRYGSLVIAELASVVAGIAVSIAMAVAGWGYWALVGGQLAAAIALGAGVWSRCRWRPGRPATGGAGVRSMVRLGANVTGYNVVNYLARNVDDVLIGRFAGTGALGLYQKAYELFLLPITLIVQPIGRVALPALSRLRGEPDRYRDLYVGMLERILLLTAPLGAFLMSTGDWLVLVVLGDGWAQAGRLLQVLGVLMFVQPVAYSTGWLFISQDRAGEMLRWGFVGSALCLAAFAAGIPWGAFGLAAAYAGSGVVLRLPVLLWWVGRHGPVRTRDFYRTAAPFWLAGLAGIAAVGTFRLLVPTTSPVEGLVAAAPIILGVTVACLSLSLPGRVVMTDLVRGLRHLRREEGLAAGSES